MSKIIHNPVIRGEGASPRDPWVILHEGMYYHCFSRGGSVWVNRVESLNDLDNGGEVSVYTPPEGTAYSKELWAPELHFLDGRFYIYVACDDGENANHRMYVLEGTDDPLAPFAFVGKITDPTDRWAIDGTVVEWEGNRYFVWSGWEGTEKRRPEPLYCADGQPDLDLLGAGAAFCAEVCLGEGRRRRQKPPLCQRGAGGADPRRPAAHCLLGGGVVVQRLLPRHALLAAGGGRPDVSRRLRKRRRFRFSPAMRTPKGRGIAPLPP